MQYDLFEKILKDKIIWPNVGKMYQAAFHSQITKKVSLYHQFLSTSILGQTFIIARIEKYASTYAYVVRMHTHSINRFLEDNFFKKPNQLIKIITPHYFMKPTISQHF